MDYLHRLLGCAPGEELLLLPSPYATVLSIDGTVRLVGPHSTVHRFRGIDALMTCTPNVIKAFAGHPRLFVDGSVSTEEVPLLHTFREHPPSQWPTLLDDLRRSVDVTDDERQFETVWQSLLNRTTSAGSSAQRQEERLCRRYAGQPPAAARRQLRLSAQLAADIAAGRHRSLGEFTDQSHYVRECKALTGHVPGRWWRTSATCHASDGSPVPRAQSRSLVGGDSRPPTSAPRPRNLQP